VAVVGDRIPGVERIAVLRANAIGDLIVALPALTALRAAYPGAEITLLGRNHHVAILETRPGPVDRVIALPDGAIGDESEAASPCIDRAELLADLARRGFDLAIQLHGGGRNSNPFVRGLGARFTAGSRTPDAPPLDRWVTYQPNQWEIARYLDVVRLVGAEPVGVEPHLGATDDDRRALAAELPDLDGSGWLVIHPGATDPRRRWPIEAFGEVGAVFARCGRHVVVTGTPAEARLVHATAAAIGDALPVTHLSLPALIGLLSGADLVVSNDTGPLHLAIALGTPTVGIFWIGNLIHAGPFSRLRDRAVVSWRLDCPVCGAAATAGRCPHDPSFVADIPVTAVLDAANDLLARPWT